MNYMNAFFSGTDNRDDGANISFSGVVGQMNKETPQTVWRFNYQDRKFEAKFEDIFDVVATEIPDEWIEQVKISAPPLPRGGYTYEGIPGARSRAEHLKPYQFKKTTPEAEGLVNGNRAGPYNRKQPFGAEDDVYEGRLPLDFGGEFWGMGGEYDLVGGGRDERMSAAERALAQVVEDPMEGRSLGKTVGGPAKNNARSKDVTLEVEAGSPELRDDGVPGENSLWSGHDRYDELVINHGEAVADAFCLTDDCMSALAGKDELLEELVFDMFELSSDEGQAHMFRQLYDRLPRAVQDKIATSGF